MNLRSILETLRFEEEWGTLTDQEPSYAIRLGHLQITIVQVTSEYLQPVFLMQGTFRTSRQLGSNHLDLPVEVESFEQGLAWIAYAVDLVGPVAEPPDWLIRGRELQEHLPWIRSARDYEGRPRCVVDMEWWRIATKKLRSLSESATSSDVMTVHFDEEILKFATPAKVVAVTADGKAWKSPVAIQTQKLDFLPKRHVGLTIEVSVWKDQLRIGRRCWNAVTPLGAP